MLEVYSKTIIAFQKLIKDYPNIIFKKFPKNSVGFISKVEAIDKIAGEFDLNENELNSLMKLIKSQTQTL